VNRIGWCDETWNPMTGCTPVSEACEHCWAERMAWRFGKTKTESDFTPTFHPDRLDKPLHWRKPRRIFVCSMSDPFHPEFTNDQIFSVWSTMAACPQHTFIVLTKRPMRAHTLIADPCWHDDWLDRPLPNVHLGVTAENQQRADERIPILLDTPAAVRFVCCEPLLSAVNVAPYLFATASTAPSPMNAYGLPGSRPRLDWVICGGENGPGARPMQPEWALDIYQRCQAAGVAFWWKGPGAHLARENVELSVFRQMLEMEDVRELPK
jgi:protein gp37